MGMRSKSKASSRSHTCAPPAGQTYLCIGQDLFSIDNYVREQYNYSLHHTDATTTSRRKYHQAAASSSFMDYFPAAVMSYTDLQRLRGLEEPSDYGSGIEYAGMLDDSSSLWRMPSHHNHDSNDKSTLPALQLGLWLNGSQGCRDIIDGALDDHLHRLFHVLARRSHSTFLRVGYEFDNPSFGYSDDPAAYQQAFRVMVDSCRHRVQHCRDKVHFVWHSWAASDVNLTAFYPGDDYVDWVGVSLFLQLYRDPTAAMTNTSASLSTSNDTMTSTYVVNPMVQRVLDFGQQHGKPLMIAESTPFGGIDKLHDPWASWFEPVLQVIDDYDVGVFSYISCDWESQPMWRGVGFGDSRLTTNKTVMQLWRDHVVNSPRFRAKGVSCERNHEATTLLGQADPNYVGTVHHMSRTSEDALIGAFVVSLVLFATAMAVLVSRFKPNDERGFSLEPGQRHRPTKLSYSGYGSINWYST